MKRHMENLADAAFTIVCFVLFGFVLLYAAVDTVGKYILSSLRRKEGPLPPRE